MTALNSKMNGTQSVTILEDVRSDKSVFFSFILNNLTSLIAVVTFLGKMCSFVSFPAGVVCPA